MFCYVKCSIKGYYKITWTKTNSFVLWMLRLKIMQNSILICISWSSYLKFVLDHYSLQQGEHLELLSYWCSAEMWKIYGSFTTRLLEWLLWFWSGSHPAGLVNLILLQRKDIDIWSTVIRSDRVHTQRDSSSAFILCSKKKKRTVQELRCVPF